MAGVAGLPALELDLGPLTALVGPRGSGQSQLLSAIAWLVAGRPRIVPAVDAPATQMAGELRVGGQVAFIARTPGVGLVSDPARQRRSALPACSMLQAQDRFDPPYGATGRGRAALGGHGRSGD